MRFSRIILTLAGTTATVLIVGIVALQLSPAPSSPPLHITTKGAKAFGELSMGAADFPTNTMALGADTARSAITMNERAAGDIMDDTTEPASIDGGIRFIDHAPTPRYSYDGIWPALTESAKVYRYVPSPLLADKGMQDLFRPYADLSKMNGARVTSISIEEPGSKGWQVSITPSTGDVSYYRKGDWHTPEAIAGDALNDTQAINVANNFLRDRGIATVGFGEPMVQQYGGYAEIRPLIADGREPGVTAPDASPTVSIVFPKMIDGLPVVSQSGYPTGITVAVHRTRREVISASIPQSFTGGTLTSSEYPLTTDTAVLTALLRDRGYSYSYGEGDVITVEAPTLVLVEIFQYDISGNEPTRLYAPALLFTVEGAQYGSNLDPAVIPLTTDLVRELQASKATTGDVRTMISPTAPDTSVKNLEGGGSTSSKTRE